MSDLVKPARIPEPTCPSIDAAIEALEQLRNDNAQMRYGYFAMKEFVDCHKVRISELEAENAKHREAINLAMSEISKWAAKSGTLEAAIIAALRARDEDRGDILRKALHGGGE